MAEDWAGWAWIVWWGSWAFVAWHALMELAEMANADRKCLPQRRRARRP